MPLRACLCVQDRILDRPPFPKKASIITLLMWRFIICHSLYQFVVLSVMLFMGAGTPIEAGGLFDIYSGIDSDFEFDMGNGPEHMTCWDLQVACDKLTPDSKAAMLAGTMEPNNCPDAQACSSHFAMLFTTFVMMQLVNQLNARKLQQNEWNIFVGLFSNMLFLYITAGEFLAQVVISTFGGAVFKVTGGLTTDQWIVCMAFAFGHLPFHLIVCCVPPSLFNCLMAGDKAAAPAPAAPAADVEAPHGGRPRMRTATKFGDVEPATKENETYTPNTIKTSGRVRLLFALHSWLPWLLLACTPPVCSQRACLLRNGSDDRRGLARMASRS